MRRRRDRVPVGHLNLRPDQPLDPRSSRRSSEEQKVSTTLARAGGGGRRSRAGQDPCHTSVGPHHAVPGEVANLYEVAGLTAALGSGAAPIDEWIVRVENDLRRTTRYQPTSLMKSSTEISTVRMTLRRVPRSRTRWVGTVTGGRPVHSRRTWLPF